MPYSTLYTFDYVDSESEYQFKLSCHNLIIFDCKYCKNAKISKKHAVYECDNRHLDCILEISCVCISLKEKKAQCR